MGFLAAPAPWPRREPPNPRVAAEFSIEGLQGNDPTLLRGLPAFFETVFGGAAAGVSETVVRNRTRSDASGLKEQGFLPTASHKSIPVPHRRSGSVQRQVSSLHKCCSHHPAYTGASVPRMRRFYAAIIALCSAANALQPASSITARHRVVCHGKKTNAILGALRRVPLVKRVVPKKERAPRTPPPPETSVEAAPEIAELIDAEPARRRRSSRRSSSRSSSAASPCRTRPSRSRRNRSGASTGGEPDRRSPSTPAGPDGVLNELRDASRDTNAVDVDVEWRYARACLDAANALPEKDPKREGLTFEGLRAAERAAAVAPDDGLAQKWLGVMLGSVGDFQTTKEKIQNSYKVREALDAAYKLRPDDATVALALGQWCLKVAGVSFVERGLARAIFGGSPPESTYAEALKFFRKAQELKPASKTKALIKLVEGKMRNGGR